MDHQYAVGDRVSLAFGFHDTDAIGTYIVSRLLPSLVDGEPQYRVKDSDDRERVIGEAQIVGAKRQDGRPHQPRSPQNPITDLLNRSNQKLR